MAKTDCVFCKIINKEIPKEFAYEDEHVVVFKDIKPSAPVHYLSVSKEHIPSIAHLIPAHEAVVFAVILAAKKVAEQEGLKGYKLAFNVGREGGQMIDHLHLHLLGGWQKGEGERLLSPELDR